jgi:hypothetical protein
VTGVELLAAARIEHDGAVIRKNATQFTGANLVRFLIWFGQRGLQDAELFGIGAGREYRSGGQRRDINYGRDFHGMSPFGWFGRIHESWQRRFSPTSISAGSARDY